MDNQFSRASVILKVMIVDSYEKMPFPPLSNRDYGLTKCYGTVFSNACAGGHSYSRLLAIHSRRGAITKIYTLISGGSWLPYLIQQDVLRKEVP